MTISVNALGELDPSDGTFSADAYIYYAWQDDRYNSTADVSLHSDSFSVILLKACPIAGRGVFPQLSG